jgi:UDP-GlcNAc:undecaprenyl-phosphate GlcNAc-1-phosphate transferase
VTDGLRALAALVLAGGLTLLATPLAIRLAHRTQFLDHPVAYKGHRSATPYLGGAAVFGAFLLTALALADGLGRFGVALACAALLCVVGTVDDRLGLGPLARVLVAVAAAIALWADDIGWMLFDSETGNLLLTVVWVVGLVNAFNLMDNIDGAAGTVATVSALGIGTLGLLHDDGAVVGFGFALAGACIAFLRFNLAGPARIFLGDGGSMPLGFLVAAGAIAAVSANESLGDAGILSGAMLAGLVILDTTLVTLSRRRRGAPLLSGGRDHLTHRILGRVGSAQGVATVLAAVQAALCLSAIAADYADSRSLLFAVSAVWVTLGLAAIGVLETQPLPAASRQPAGE